MPSNGDSKDDNNSGVSEVVENNQPKVVATVKKVAIRHWKKLPAMA